MAPEERHKECTVWMMAIIGCIVSASIVTGIMHLENYPRWDIYTKLVLTSAGIIASLWSLWVLSAFRDIFQWWRRMHSDMDTALALLKESKDDLEEIKKYSKR